MKAVVGASDDRILGFTMIGSEAGEVLAAIQTAMMAGLPVYEAARRRHLAPDHGRRPRPAVREHPDAIDLTTRNQTAEAGCPLERFPID